MSGSWSDWIGDGGRTVELLKLLQTNGTMLDEHLPCNSLPCEIRTDDPFIHFKMSLPLSTNDSQSVGFPWKCGTNQTPSSLKTQFCASGWWQGIWNIFDTAVIEQGEEEHHLMLIDSNSTVNAPENEIPTSPWVCASNLLCKEQNRSETWEKPFLRGLSL